jgi:hypothetical protein
MFKPLREIISRQGVSDELYWLVVAVTDIVKLLTGAEKHVFVDCASAATIFLPPVSQMAGGTILIVNTTGTATLTVKPFAEGAAHDGAADSTIYNGAAAVTEQALANAGAYTLLYSSGKKWYTLSFDLSI